jgi:hypothetical protein
MTTVFPLFQQYIEPHLVHAHVGTRNTTVHLYFSYMIVHCSVFLCSVSDMYLCSMLFLFSWQLKIQNDFDPVLSPESSLFVLKSKTQVLYSFFMPVTLFL